MDVRVTNVVRIPCLLGVAWLSAVVMVSAQLDLNTNGVSDVWEASHGVGLDQGVDSDGDGFTNGEEARSGTNPHDASSFPRSGFFRIEGGDRALIDFSTVAGVHYQLEASTNLTSWMRFGPPVIGDGSPELLVYDMRQSFAPGGLSASVWTGLTGFGVSLISTYVSNNAPAPHVLRTFTRLEYPQTAPNEEQFGVHVAGWIIPPVSGTYTFWLASDDGSELWLSTNELPSGRQRIAYVTGWTGFREWTKYTSQQSVPVSLESNRTYFVEVFHRESFGGDHLSVAWTRPDASPESREIIAGPWLTPAPGSLLDFARGENPLALRLSVEQVDSDLDGLLDYEEEILGLNPLATNSTPRQPDHAEALRIMQSENSITIGATVPRAYESTTGAGQLTVYRDGNIDPLTVSYHLSGSAVSGSDYEPLAGSVVFGPGQRFASIDIIPVNDGIIETSEHVVVTLQTGASHVLGSPSSATVTLDDAPDILYVAQMRAADGVIGGGSGVGSVRRMGNALSATINLSFNGLKAEQLAAEIVLSSNGMSGTVIKSLPPGQVSLLPWDFSPTNGLTGEAIIDALAQGHAWMRIRTSSNPGAELIGPLIQAPG